MAWALFLVASGALLYVLAGYPLWVAFRARRYPWRVQKRDYQDRVSVLIAVRNGERWLRRKLDSVLGLDYPPELLDVIVISDGSTDGTEEIAKEYAGRGVRLLCVPHGGKPSALNAAVPEARGELLFLTDVRQVLQRDCLKLLVNCMADPEVGVVSGNLQIRSGAHEEEQNTGLYWRYENWIRNNLAQIDSMLGATGPVNLVRRKLYVPIPPDSLLDDVFLPLSIHLQGYRLILEDRAIALDEPTLLDSEFRRKVRTQAGIVQLLKTFPGLFSAKNRLRIPFVSLKIGRLLLPFFLITLFVSTWLLPSPWRWLLGLPQVLFWGLAVVDPWMPAGSLPKKFTAFPRAFGVLISAALWAWSVLFVPPRRLWVETRAATGPNPRPAP